MTLFQLSAEVGLGLLDALLGGLFGAGEALGVDAEENRDAAAGPLRYLGWGDASVEPCGQPSVAQVVGR